MGSSVWGSQVSLASTKEKACCRNCVTRRCLFITFIALLILGIIVAAIVLGITFGIPAKQPVNRQCKTAEDKTGFLCDDRTTCITSSKVCDGRGNCIHGEDESNLYCGDLPNSLPENLHFTCADKRTWTYTDRVCNSKNDCGDCSDESVLQCPVCTSWRCDTVFFSDCGCISKTRCKDGIQDCIDWSDETKCI
ncbi:low-density lipoprotein receptor class A domain-containing protein 1-like [Latimeria chalumnae]|uniref:low-density lipoprotein receptor class A domain-containing protein 1-like n=1 Tax=Latimeria chalumnae TaxID=7897 RepID=UPI00313A9983